MNEYELKKQMRIDGLRERAEKAQVESDGARRAADRLREHIPLGQPILVGHHSERRARRDAERGRRLDEKAHEAHQRAAELARRADAAEENTAISSDDPDAVAKLEAKLAEQRAEHARGVAGNKAIRAAKGDREAAERALLALGFAPAQVSRALMINYGDKVYGFFVGNAAAAVRATERRIAELRAKAAAPAREPLTIGDATMTWDKDENRVQIRFPGKPDEPTREQLRAAGFRWAPSAGAWQRQASETAWYRGGEILRGRAGE